MRYEHEYVFGTALAEKRKEQACCVHRPHAHDMSVREALPGAKQAGGHYGEGIDRKGSPPREEKPRRGP